MATEVMYTVTCDYHGKRFMRYVANIEALRKECARRGYKVVSVSQPKTVESIAPAGVRI